MQNNKILEVIGRISDERNEVNDRLEKLGSYKNSPGFKQLAEHHRNLLNNQYATMERYIEILDTRLKYLKQENGITD